MNDLRSFTNLQARVYEFLSQQDEITLQAIVSGSVRLAVLPHDEAPATGSGIAGEKAGVASSATPASYRMSPSDDPLQAAQDLSKLESDAERRIYLNASGLRVRELQSIAKIRGFRGYSRLDRATLVELVARSGPDQSDAPAARPPTRAPSSPDPASPDPASPDPANGTSAAEPRSTSGTAEPDANVAAIASRLRETETEEAGAVYLDAQNLDRESLLAVAAELGLTRVNRLSQTELEKRVLKQAIGARRKFAGLRKW